MTNKAVLAFATLSLTLVGCAETRMGPVTATPKPTPAPAAVEPPSGAIPGSASISSPSATIVGALAGAYVGGEIAKSLDDRDRGAMQKSTQQALTSTPAGKTAVWSNPATGSSGSVTPQPSYRDGKGRLCREYQETVKARGLSKTGYRTACQETDGSWRLVNG